MFKSTTSIPRLYSTGLFSRQCLRYTSSTLKFSPETTKALSLMSSDHSAGYYAILELKSFPYKVAKNDIIVTGRLSNASIGDTLELNRVREIGSASYTLRGNPYLRPDYFNIKATVLEHQVAPTSKKRQQRSGRSKTVHNENHYTLLRISELDVVSPEKMNASTKEILNE